MSRVKKSRKVGQIGIPKADKSKPRVRSDEPKRQKSSTGKPAGSRNSPVKNKSLVKTHKPKLDSRVGSKKAVPLVVEAKPLKQNTKKKFFSPGEELKTLENDVSLGALLDKVDAGQTLSKEQQTELDTKLARHKELCDLLGLGQEDEDEHDFDQYDAGDLDDHK